MSKVYLVRIISKYAVFGIEVQNGIIIRTAPIGAKLLNKNYNEVRKTNNNYVFEDIDYMSTREGTVQFSNQKEWTDPKTGSTKTLYSIKLQGSNEYINFGESNPNLSQGDIVTIVVQENNGKVRAKASDITRKGKAEVPKTTNWRRGGSGAANQQREQYWQKKLEMDLEMQPEFRYRSAMDKAISLLRVLQEAEALPISKANQASAQKKYDAMMALVFTVTDQIVKKFEEVSKPEETKEEVKEETGENFESVKED